MSAWRHQLGGGADLASMGLFNRKKSAPDMADGTDATGLTTIAGIPSEVVATGDFDIVIRQLIRQLAPAGSELVELGDDTVTAGGTQTYLGNLRGGWNQRAPGEREIWLRDAIYGIYRSELRDTSNLDLSMLRPGIRSEWTVQLPMLMAAAQNPDAPVDPGSRVAMRPMADGLARVLIWDTPTTMSPINEAQVADWGAEFDDLWPVAVANLAQDPSNDGWACAQDCVWISLNEDDYAAERIFIDGFLDKPGFEHVVLFHPHRSRLIIADLMNPDSLVIAATIALQEADRPNPVSLNPIVGKGLHWHPLELQPGHPADPLIRQLRLTEHAETYQSQHQLLDRLFGDDLFVAGYQAFEADGAVSSFCSWTEGVPSLLPKTDVIGFVTSTGEARLVPWEEAARVVGARIEPTEHFPSRSRVSSFPTPEELAAMAPLPM